MPARIEVATKMVGDRLTASVQLSSVNAADLVCAADCLLRIARDNVEADDERVSIDRALESLGAWLGPVGGGKVDTREH